MWIVVEKKASAPLKKVMEDMPWIFLKKKKGGLWIERESMDVEYESIGVIGLLK